MLPMAHNCHDGDWIYQQENEPIHFYILSMKWFKDNNVFLLPWTAKYAVLIPIENLWGILTMHFYASYKFYSTASELKDAIQVPVE